MAKSEKNIDKANDWYGVSVIIPAFNVETCLKRAVLSALEQDPSPFEVIVINDGSTDGTAEIARSLGERIVYIEQINQGQGAARNAGLEVAKGEFIAFLDADDYWLSGFLKATTDFLQVHPNAVAVSTGFKYRKRNGQIVCFPESQSPVEVTKKAVILDDFYHFWGKYDHVRTGTVLIRHSTIKKAGDQQAHLRISQDLEYWGYIATQGYWGFIPEIYWFGDSAREAIKSGWLKKYRLRRKLCPTVELWQERIVPMLANTDWPGFRVVRGRVASNYAHTMILAGRYQEAIKIMKVYGTEMPNNRTTQLMRFGAESGRLGWRMVCFLFLLREYLKYFK